MTTELQARKGKRGNRGKSCREKGSRNPRERMHRLIIIIKQSSGCQVCSHTYPSRPEIPSSGKERRRRRFNQRIILLLLSTLKGCLYACVCVCDVSL